MRYRSDRSPPLLPPRRKNWTKGNYQIGFFLRMPDGGTIESVSDKAEDGEPYTDVALALLHVFHCKGCKACKDVARKARVLRKQIEKNRGRRAR